MSRALFRLSVLFAGIGTAYLSSHGLAYLLDHSVGPRGTLTWAANPEALTVGYFLVFVHSVVWTVAIVAYGRWLSR